MNLYIDAISFGHTLSLILVQSYDCSIDYNHRRFIYSQLYFTYLRKSTTRAECTLNSGVTV